MQSRPQAMKWPAQMARCQSPARLSDVAMGVATLSPSPQINRCVEQAPRANRKSKSVHEPHATRPQPKHRSRPRSVRRLAVSADHRTVWPKAKGCHTDQMIIIPVEATATARLQQATPQQNANMSPSLLGHVQGSLCLSSS